MLVLSPRPGGWPGVSFFCLFEDVFVFPRVFVCFHMSERLYVCNQYFVLRLGGNWPELMIKTIIFCAQQKYLCLSISGCLCVCVFHFHMYVCMLVLAPAWVAWSLGRSPVFLRPLADVAFLKTAGQGVAEHLDEAEAQCGCHWETSMGSLHYPEQDLLHPSVFLRVFGSILSSVQSLCTCYKTTRESRITLCCTKFAFF